MAKPFIPGAALFLCTMARDLLLRLEVFGHDVA
jgi:hypothetical protein